MIVPTAEMVRVFHERTRRHIAGVGVNLIALSGLRGVRRAELQARARGHDRSKFEEAEKLGYIWLTWKYRGGFTPPEIQSTIDSAQLHHRSHNRHHPEAHAHPSEMNVLDLAEMISDWHAISQENGLPPGSTRNWARQNLGRWDFCTEQIEAVYDGIAILEGNGPEVGP